jgi:hypothetical protein
MRRLFLVLAKLAGLVLVYLALVNVIQIGFTIHVMTGPAAPPGGQAISGALGIFLCFCLSLAMAWLLLARTEWLADRLRIREDAATGIPGDDVILRTGIALIGVYVTVNAIPAFARAILDSGIFLALHEGGRFWSRLLPAAVQLGLGLFCAFRSRRVLDWITALRTVAEPR